MYNFQLVNNVPLSDKWKDSAVFQNKNNLFNEMGQKITEQYQGIMYRVISKKERQLSYFERFYRILLGAIAVLCTLGCALKAKKVRHLFTNRTVKVRYAELYKPEQKEPKQTPHSTKAPITEPSQVQPVVQPVPTKEPTQVHHSVQPVPAKEPTQDTPKKPLSRSLPEAPSGEVKNGYGGYLIYRNQNNNKVPISESEYLKIYDLIEECRTSSHRPDDFQAYLKGKIQEKLGKDVCLAFIPRTLYELIYLRQCFQEEIDKNKGTNGKHLQIERIFVEDSNDPYFYPAAIKHKVLEEIQKQGFWQLCIFDDKDYNNHLSPKTDFDFFRQEHVKKVAARLNVVALAQFKSSYENEGFTFSDIKDVKDELISYCRQMCDPTSENYKKVLKLNADTFLSVTQMFALEAYERNTHPLCISNERREQLVSKAIQLECSAEAVNSVVLYRGSHFAEDAITKKWDGNKTHPNMLSYGNSLFAGALYDPGACAYRYMRTDRDSQAFVIPSREILKQSSIFHSHQVHPLIQLMSKGEFFHGRTKIWKINDEDKVLGYVTGGSIKYSELEPFCKTEMTQEQAIESFEYHKKKAYLLV